MLKIKISIFRQFSSIFVNFRPVFSSLTLFRMSLYYLFIKMKITRLPLNTNGRTHLVINITSLYNSYAGL